MKRKEKLLGLFMVLFAMISVNAFAGGGNSHATHYGKVTVTSNGNGSVYIGTENNATSGDTEVTWNCNKNESGDTKTYYLFAKPATGYRLKDWSGYGTSTDNPYKITPKAESPTEGTPTIFSYIATFEPNPQYYSQATVSTCGNGTGSVSVSTEGESSSGNTASQNSNDVEKPTHKYVFSATPNSGSIFKGWSKTENGNIESTDNPYTYSFKAESTDQGNPTKGTLYAVFEKPNYDWYNETAVEGQFYIRNSNGKFVKNASTELADNIEDAGLFTLVKDGNTGKFFIQNENGNWLTWGAELVVSNEGDLKVNNTSNRGAGQNLSFTFDEQGRIYYGSLTGAVYLRINNNSLAKGANSNNIWQLISPEQKEDINEDHSAYDIAYTNAMPYNTDEILAKLSDETKEELTTLLKTPVYYGNCDELTQRLIAVKEACDAEIALYDDKIDDYHNALSANNLPLSEEDYKKLSPAVKEAYDAVINNINAGTIESAINNMESVAKACFDDINFYDDKISAYNEAKEAADAYSSNPIIAQNTALKNRLTNALNTTVNAGNIVAQTAELVDVKKACEDYLASLNMDNTVDVSGLIKNPDFGYALINNPGLSNWDNKGAKHGSSNDNKGADNERGFADLNIGSAGNNNSISQTVNDVPAGVYELEFYWRTTQDANMSVTANDAVWNKTESTGAWTKESMYVVVGDDGKLVITAQASAATSGQWANVDRFRLYYAGETDEVVLNIKKDCYGTFIAPFDVTLPDGVIAFSASSPSDDYVTFTEFSLTDQKLPAGTPVIVRMNDHSAKNQTYYGPKATGSVLDNGLLGYYNSGNKLSKGCYVLQDQGQGQMFYVVTADNTFTISKNRCCLPAATGGAAKVLRIAFEDTTAIGGNITEATVAGYYSINGTKLSAPKSGVNIVKMSDGSVKKVLIK